jgi:hypothetical protein
MKLRKKLGFATQIILIPFVAVLCWLAVFDGPVAALSPVSELLIRALFALAAVALSALLHLSLRHREVEDGPCEPEPDNPKTDEVLDREIDKSLSLVGKKYASPGSLPLFSRLLLDTKLLARTHDRVDVLDQALEVHTSIDYSFDRPLADDDCEVPVAVPVMDVRKGVLLDSFEVSDATGAVLSTLNQNETRGMIAHAIIGCYAIAYGDDVKMLLVSNNRPPALKRILHMVYGRGRRDVDEVAGEYEKTVSGLKLADGPAAKFCAERLRLLSTYFARHYVVAADMRLQKSETRIHLQYRQIAPFYGLAEKQQSRLRARLGLRPFIFKVPMPLMYRSGSYHFLLRGEQGQYVQNHAVLDTATGEILDASNVRNRYPGSYMRVRNRAGLPYGRLYARGFERTETTQLASLASVVTFAEVPPGALGGAAKVVTVTAALVTLFAFLRPSVTDVSSDAAALLLAAPAAMASWVGHSAERLRQSSLATYFALLAAQVVSVLSAGLYITERRLPEASDELLTVHDQGVLGIITLPDFDSAWIALSVFSIGLTFYLNVLKFRRLRGYLRAARRWDTMV